MTQSEWDRMLIEAFYKSPDVPMSHCNANWTGLLRTPREFGMQNMSVMRFVCACLPKLANVLWDRNVQDIDKVVDVLKASKLDASLVYTKRDRADQYMRRASNRRSQRSQREIVVSKAYRQASDGTAWNVCS